MGFFESLFYTIWRGIAIGVLISAPMGPVGILCIQRTLYKGRKTGLYTGIGAAISDLFYCILTGFGLSFIEEFLERNQNVIQLVGSIVLIAFAIYLFKKNPASSLKTPQGETPQVSPHKNILGGFLFTFSNPLILFLIIGLFARFNFSIPEISFYYYIAGYAAIFCGAVLWWYFVTFSVNKLRAHFNLRSMWLINRIIGVIILIFALVGIITGVTNIASAETLHWNQGRGYLPFKYATESGILIENTSDSLIYDFQSLNPPADNFTIDFRARSLTPTPYWGFILTCGQDTIVMEVKNREVQTTVESQAALALDIFKRADKEKSEIILTEKINPYGGDNLWKIQSIGGELIIFAGNHSMPEVFKASVKGEITGFGFYAGYHHKVIISDINLEYSSDKASLSTGVEEMDVEDYFSKSQDDMEGYWTLFDRDLEESLLKLGGNYTLICLKEGEDYVFRYIAGAKINSKAWQSGDVKLMLHPTPFEGIYDVEWVDSMKESMPEGLKAQTGEGNTLLIQFPYQSSKLRLRKVPKGD